MTAQRTDDPDGLSSAENHPPINGTGTIQFEDALVDVELHVRPGRRSDTPERYAVNLKVRGPVGAATVSLTPGEARDLSTRLEAAADEYAAD